MVVPGWLRPLAEKAPYADSPPPYQPPAEGGRASAVLVLFGEGSRGPDLLLIERSADLRDHAGQPAFPGGGVDPEDAGPVDAALREGAEETGLDPIGVDVFATMPRLYITRSGFVVTPVLGWWREPCDVGPVDPREIAAVARVPVDDLVDPSNRLLARGPGGWTGPAFRVSDMLVWGFTAGLLDRLLRLAGWDRPWDTSRIEKVPFPPRLR